MRSSSFIASSSGSTLPGAAPGRGVREAPGAAAGHRAGLGRRARRRRRRAGRWLVKQPDGGRGDDEASTITTATSGRIESRAVYPYIEPPLDEADACPSVSPSSPTTSPAPVTPARCSRAAGRCPSPSGRGAPSRPPCAWSTPRAARLPPAEAAERVGAVAEPRPAGRWFKKIDSTLRGRIGAEVDALMRATGPRTAVVCPAFPAQGRVVLDRVLLVDGVPVAETPIARDPQFRGRGAPAWSISCGRSSTARWPGSPSISSRAADETLAARLGRLAGPRSSPTPRPMPTSTRSWRPRSPSRRAPLLVGSAGLARALAARLGLLGRARRAAGRRTLAGRRRQPAPGHAPADPRWRARPGSACSPRPSARPPTARTRSRGWSSRRWRRCEREALGPAWSSPAARRRSRCATALGAERIDLVGVPGPGLALGHLRVPGRDPPCRCSPRPAASGHPTCSCRCKRRRVARKRPVLGRDDGRSRRRRARDHRAGGGRAGGARGVPSGGDRRRRRTMREALGPGRRRPWRSTR